MTLVDASKINSMTELHEILYHTLTPIFDNHELSEKEQEILANMMKVYADVYHRLMLEKKVKKSEVLTQDGSRILET